MPRVVCSTIEWVLTKRLSEIIPKKRMPRAGDSFSTTKPTLRDHPKSCPNDRNYITGLWMSDIHIHYCYCNNGHLSLIRTHGYHIFISEDQSKRLPKPKALMIPVAQPPPVVTYWLLLQSLHIAKSSVHNGESTRFSLVRKNKQTNRQADKQTNKQIDKQTNRQTNIRPPIMQ